MTILWLEDRPETISFEVELIREANDDIKIEIFTYIDQLLQHLEDENFSEENAIFIIDVMLTRETNIRFGETNVTIPENLMAGVTLYTECLAKYFPNIPVILYSSRGEFSEILEIIQNKENKDRYNETLFYVGKEELETDFKRVLLKLGVKL